MNETACRGTNLLMKRMTTTSSLTVAAGPNQAELSRMLTDYDYWLQYLNQADTQSTKLRQKLAYFGRQYPLLWLLAQFLRYQV